MRFFLRAMWIDVLRQTEIRAMTHVRYALWPSEPEGHPSIAASLAELDRVKLRAVSTGVHGNWGRETP